MADGIERLSRQSASARSPQPGCLNPLQCVSEIDQSLMAETPRVILG